MITSKRPCDQTLGQVHVFYERRASWVPRPLPAGLRCVCGALPNDEEYAAYKAAVAQHRREEAEAEAQRIRRGR